jgi:hypothetical protein
VAAQCPLADSECVTADRVEADVLPNSEEPRGIEACVAVPT